MCSHEKSDVKPGFAMLLPRPHAAVFACALLFWAVAGAGADVAPGSGMEVLRPTSLEYVVEQVSQDGRRLGISKEQIRHVVEQQLRGAGITPVDGEATGTVDPFVYVRVAVGGNGFNIRVEFSRPVVYEVDGRLLTTFGVMWSDSITGWSMDGDYVVGALDRPMRRFIEEFRKANRL
jgi:hypothetical protein